MRKWGAGAGEGVNGICVVEGDDPIVGNDGITLASGNSSANPNFTFPFLYFLNEPHYH